MNSGWRNSLGVVLVVAAILLLVVLHRLDLLFIATPLSVLYGFWVRVGARRPSVRIETQHEPTSR